MYVFIHIFINSLFFLLYNQNLLLDIEKDIKVHFLYFNQKIINKVPYVSLVYTLHPLENVTPYKFVSYILFYFYYDKVDLADL